MEEKKCNICKISYYTDFIKNNKCKYCEYDSDNKSKIKKFIIYFLKNTKDENDILTLEDVIKIFNKYYRLYCDDNSIVIFNHYYDYIYKMLRWNNIGKLINQKDDINLYKNQLYMIKFTNIKLVYPIEKLKC